MRIRSGRFRVPQGRTMTMRAWPTRVAPVYASEEEYHETLVAHVARLQSLQERLYASDRYAVLVVFQAMDAAGKDGAIKHVMSGVNPQGCRVFGFKRPSTTELQHDFLWRCTRELPERGQIGIFNRSYYEDVLVTRVHPELLAGEGVRTRRSGDPSFWRHRYRSIADFERHLHRNGTRVVKCYLHLSRKEQRRRLLERIDIPDKNWKLSLADVAERAFWTPYMHAYAECLGATSTRHAPWYVVPADDKDNARLIVSQIIIDTLEALGLRYPAPTPGRRRELRAMRARLTR